MNVANNIYELTVMMTEACNASCTFCTQKHNTNNTMTIERLHQIIIDFKKTNPETDYILAFFGGEPLMNFEVIEEFLNNFNDPKCIQKKITTNGILLNDHIYRVCLKHNIAIGLSYDGLFQEQRKYKLSNATKEIIKNDQKIITLNFGVHEQGDRLLEQYLNLKAEFNLAPDKINFYFNRNYWEWTQSEVMAFGRGLLELIMWCNESKIRLPNRLIQYCDNIIAAGTSKYRFGCGAGETHFSYTLTEKRSCGIMDLGKPAIDVPTTQEIVDMCDGCSIADVCIKTCPIVLERAIQAGIGQQNAQCQIHKIIVTLLRKYHLNFKGK